MREYSLREHKQIIDAYAALGYDLDTIAISKGFYQPDASYYVCADPDFGGIQFYKLDQYWCDPGFFPAQLCEIIYDT